jgi:hypothetical protein
MLTEDTTFERRNIPIKVLGALKDCVAPSQDLHESFTIFKERLHSKTKPKENIYFLHGCKTICDFWIYTEKDVNTEMGHNPGMLRLGVTFHNT